MAGANLIYGMGMLELGLTFDFGQAVIDDEIARMIRRVLDGIDVDAGSIALGSILRVGSGGNFLREPLTRSAGPREQSRAEIIDRRTRGAWERRGGGDLHERATEAARRTLAEHRVPSLPPEAERVIARILRRSASKPHEAAERGGEE